MNGPSMLWHWFVQLTFICIAFGCMFHWWHLNDFVYHRFGWSAYRLCSTLGYLVPALFLCSMVLFLEHSARWRKSGPHSPS